jgi:RNA polymerase sigma-70 factor, ECF subfamily
MGFLLEGGAMVQVARLQEQPLVEKLPDEDLVAQIRGGDTAAFELIMRRYNRRLFRIARGILRDDGEAEDCVQEAYVRAWFAMAQFRGPAGFAGWLCRIATNEALMRRRRLARRWTVISSSGDATAAAAQPEELPSTAAGPAAQLHERQLQQLLEAAIDKLPDGCRGAFVFREVEQMTVAETASCLGIEEGAVKTRVHRARKLLQRSLRDELTMVLNGAFEFDGDRCDRVVAGVFTRINVAASGTSSAPRQE